MTDNALKYDREIQVGGESSIAKLLNWIPDGSSVLETGPATGMMTKLLKKLKNCRITCIEIDAEAAKLAEQFCDRMIIGNLNDFSWRDNLRDEKFDFIIFADVLEHLLAPAQVVNEARNFLKTTGQILISIPNIAHSGVIAELLNSRFEYRRDGILDNTHLKFFTRSSLTQLLTSSKLKALDWDRTILPPDLSEFRQSFQNLTPLQRSVLSKLEDGNTYQFLVRACVSNDELEAVLDEPSAPKDLISDRNYFVSQVYYSSDRHFSEAQSIIKHVVVSDEVIEVNYTFNASINYLRIDISDTKDSIEVLGLEIRLNTNCILNYNSSNSKLSSICEVVNAHEIYVNHRTLLLPLNDDPQLLFKLSGAGNFDVTIRFKVKIDDLIAAAVHELNEKVNYLNSSLDSLADSHDRKIKEIEEAFHAKEIALGLLDPQELETLRIEKTELERTITETSGHNAWLSAHVNYLKLNLFNKNQAHNHFVSNIVSSRSWRLTAPLRQTASAFKFTADKIKLFRNTAFSIIIRALPNNKLSLMTQGLLGITTPFSEYDLWNIRFGVGLKQLGRLSRQIDMLDRKPLISVCVISKGQNYHSFLRIIHQLKSQIYSNWELCIASDESDDPSFRSALSAYANSDDRVKFCFASNSFCESFNKVIRLATGEYFILLESDDFLLPHALYQIARVASQESQIDIIYSHIADLAGDDRRVTFFNLDDSKLKTSCALAIRSEPINQITDQLNENFASKNDLLRRLTDTNTKVRTIDDVLLKKKCTDNLLSKTKERKVSIIIPIYNSFQTAVDCLQSVIDNTTGCYEIIAIDDNSDEGDFLEYAPASLRINRTIKIIRNERNLGFVGTCNKAMLLLTKGDVVLLNSDTVVTKNWLNKIKTAAYSRDNVGTVTPLTNNGTICSVPVFLENNKVPADFSVNDINQMVESNFRGEYPEAPTCVGFCTYIKRDLIDKIGAFDSVFGKGYGEENDFSQRAQSVGYRDIIDTATFIEHKGNMSFKEMRESLSTENAKIINSRYPYYNFDVGWFCSTNPLDKTHSRLWNKLHIHYAEKTNGSILHVLHNGPFKARRNSCGGTEQHVQNLIRNSGNFSHYSLIPFGDGYILTAHLPAGDREIHIPSHLDLSNLFTKKFFDLIHLHHSIGYDFRSLTDSIVKHGNYFVSIHDYWSICDSIFLRSPDSKICDGLSCKLQCALNPDELIKKRELSQKLLSHASEIIFFSESSRSIVNRVLDVNQRYSVIPHGVNASVQMSMSPARIVSKPNSQTPLKVLFFGAIAPHKGKRLIERLAQVTKVDDVQVEWHFLGRSDLKKYKNIAHHGEYNERNFLQKISEIAPHFIAILPDCQETYSITLDEAILSGTPVITTNYGALPERVLGWNAGYVLDQSNVDCFIRILRTSICDWESYLRLRENMRTTQIIHVEEEARRYTDLYVAGTSKHASSASQLLQFLQPDLV